MNVRLSEEELLIRQSFADLFRDHFSESVVRRAEHDLGCDMSGTPGRGWLPEIWDQITELGALLPTLPEMMGGVGLGQMAAVLISEQMGRALYTSPYNETLMAAALIVESGSEGAHWPLLGGIGRGTKITLAIRESGLQDFGDPRAVRLTAQRGAGVVTVRGRKLFVPFARFVDYLLLLLAEPGGGHTLWLLPRDHPQLTIRRSDDLGRGELCVLEMGESPLPAEAVLGAVGGAAAPYVRALTHARIRHAAYQVGLAQGALDATLAYTRERHQFGRSIASFQANAFQLAALSARIEAARWHCFRLAWESDQGRSVRRQAAQLLANVGELALEVTARGLQLHGSYGFCEESEIQRYYRRAAVDCRLWGSPEHLLDEAADLLARGEELYP